MSCQQQQQHTNSANLLPAQAGRHQHSSSARQQHLPAWAHPSWHRQQACRQHRQAAQRTRGCSQHGRCIAPHEIHQVMSIGEVWIGVAATKVLQGHTVADAVLQGREAGSSGAAGRQGGDVQSIKRQ